MFGKTDWALLLKGRKDGGSLGKVGSFSPALLPHVIGQVGYGRGREGKHRCWKSEPSKSFGSNLFSWSPFSDPPLGDGDFSVAPSLESIRGEFFGPPVLVCQSPQYVASSLVFHCFFVSCYCLFCNFFCFFVFYFLMLLCFLFVFLLISISTGCLFQHCFLWFPRAPSAFSALWNGQPQQ